MNLTIERRPHGWYVTGPHIKAMVYGQHAPRGYISGLGAKKHRAAILAAVEAFRRGEDGGTSA